MNQRTSIIREFLASTRSFEIGRSLYISTPGHNRAYARRLSALAETKENLETLCYELGKLAGMDSRQIEGILNQPIQKDQKEQEQSDRPSPVDVLQKQVEELEYFELKSLVAELDLDSESQKKIDLQSAYLLYLKEQASEKEDEKKSNKSSSTGS